MKPHDQRDPLKDRLQLEADAERPAFSPALHHDLMAQIRNPQNISHRAPRRLFAYAAALLLLASLTAITAWYATRTPQPPTQNKIVPSQIAEHPAIPPHNLLAFQVGNLLAARAWPPQLAISLPFPDVSPAPQPPKPQNAPAALPQWMITKIEAQPQGANTRPRRRRP